MASEAEVWWRDLREDAEAPPAPPPAPKRGPVVLGALAAVVASAALSWWLSAPGPQPAPAPVNRPAPAPTPTIPAAPDSADAEQVRRAYEQFTLVYANSGADGVGRFSESCAQSLKGDGRILDFCLAFDSFASAVTQEAPGKAEARRLALARGALPPGADPDGRIAEVRGLVRQASGVTEVAPEPRPARTRQPVAERRPAPTPRPRAMPRPPPICIQANVADRLVCANPALAAQERRMKAAYEKALAAGADPLRVDRDQAEWRAARDGARQRGELGDLYARRIGELEAIAAPAPSPDG